MRSPKRARGSEPNPCAKHIRETCARKLSMFPCTNAKQAATDFKRKCEKARTLDGRHASAECYTMSRHRRAWTCNPPSGHLRPTTLRCLPTHQSPRHGRPFGKERGPSANSMSPSATASGHEAAKTREGERGSRRVEVEDVANACVRIFRPAIRGPIRRCWLHNSKAWEAVPGVSSRSHVCENDAASALQPARFARRAPPFRWRLAGKPEGPRAPEEGLTTTTTGGTPTVMGARDRDRTRMATGALTRTAAPAGA